MIESKALTQFNESIGSAEALLDIEKNYNDPPSLDEKNAVQGLRGGAIIIMVAAFENFLKLAIEEQLSNLSVPSNKLPYRMHRINVSNTLKPALKCAPYNRQNYDDPGRLEVEQACKIILSGNINPKAFCNTFGNPSPKNIQELFLNLGIKNLFRDIKGGFDSQWHKKEIDSFIVEKLNEIIFKRNNVAHAADALNISRSDLDTYLRFIRILAKLLESTLINHISNLKKVCV
jgi:hypothetical protein